MSLDRVLGAGAAAAAAPVVLVSWTYGVGSVTAPGAGFWPFCIALAMAALGAVLFVRPALAPAADAAASRWGKFAVGLASMVLYVLVLERLGYLLATAGLVLVQLRWVENRSWRGSVVTAFIAAAVSLVVFRTLLKVPLPLGIFPLPAGW
jgi:putative tricarboxylic transport membrane protein